MRLMVMLGLLLGVTGVAQTNPTPQCPQEGASAAKLAMCCTWPLTASCADPIWADLAAQCCPPPEHECCEVPACPGLDYSAVEFKAYWGAKRALAEVITCRETKHGKRRCRLVHER